jgi:hypothetical protein
LEDLDMPNGCSRVTRKGGVTDVISWQTGTARLLPRYLKGRTSGPLFLTERRTRVELPPVDIDQASGSAQFGYQQAELLFKEASGGATLHRLRHGVPTIHSRKQRHSQFRYPQITIKIRMAKLIPPLASSNGMAPVKEFLAIWETTQDSVTRFGTLPAMGDRVSSGCRDSAPQEIIGLSCWPLIQMTQCP